MARDGCRGAPFAGPPSQVHAADPDKHCFKLSESSMPPGSSSSVFVGPARSAASERPDSETGIRTPAGRAGSAGQPVTGSRTTPSQSESGHMNLHRGTGRRGPARYAQALQFGVVRVYIPGAAGIRGSAIRLNRLRIAGESQANQANRRRFAGP